MTTELMISGREVGPHQPPYVIAELSGNHNGELRRACQLIEAAHEAGADAVKLQTYTADTITIDHDGPGFRIEQGTWRGRSLHELYQEASTPWEWHEALFETARELGITIFSSPFDNTAVDFLEELGAPAYKIASFELVDLPLIQKAAATRKPLIISTGMATLREIEEAIAAARIAGCEEILVLYCVSGYPTPISEVNLRTLSDMRLRLGVPVGLSDHTLGSAVATAAVALGAVALEKHFTMSRAEGGPDAAFSVEPQELRALVDMTRDAWRCLGSIQYGNKDSEAPQRNLRRSLYAVKDIQVGELLDESNVRSIRPGFGLHPRHMKEVLGRKAACRILRGTPMDWALVEGHGLSNASSSG